MLASERALLIAPFLLQGEPSDEEAKAAAGGVTSEEQHIPIECRGLLPRIRAAELRRFKKESKREAKDFFAKSPRAEKALNIDPSIPSAAFAKLTSKLTRRHTSLLTPSTVTHRTHRAKQTPVENRESHHTHMCSMRTGRRNSAPLLAPMQSIQPTKRRTTTHPKKRCKVQ